MALAMPAPASTTPAPPDWSERLVAVTDLSGLSASPDGRSVLFRTEGGNGASNSYDMRWHLLDTATGRVRLVGSAGLPVYDDPGVVRRERPVWSPDGRFAFVRLLDQGGAIGVWRVDAEAATIKPLLVHDANVEELALAGDGLALTYLTGPTRAEVIAAEQAEYDDGVRIDERVDLPQALVRGGSVDGRAATQRMMGHWYIRGGLLWNAPRQRHRYDPKTGVHQLVGEPQPVAPFQPPDITAFAVAKRGASAAEAFWEAGEGGKVEARTGKRLRRCRHDLCREQRVGWMAWQPGREALVIGFQDRQLSQTLAVWRPAEDQLRIIARSEGLLSGDRHGREPCALTAGAAYCVASTAASPPMLVKVSLADGTVKPLFDPNPDWRAAYRPLVSSLRLTLADGTLVTGVQLQPPGPATGPRPLFLNYYRCEGFLRGGEGDEWPLPALLEAGFVVACLNRAPQAGPQDALGTYRTGLEAIRLLIDQLSQKGVIERTRVGMGGFSFGSEVTMWTAIHSNLLAAASIASAQWEPTGYWYSALLGSKMRAMSKAVWGLGPPDETPEAWRRMSPALNAERIRTPILFQLPEQEARQVPELVARLRATGTPVEFYGFADENHLKVQPRHRLAVYRRNGEWLRYWLQDWRDPDPSKQGQYRRWDEMRFKRDARSDPPKSAAEGRGNRLEP